VGRLPLDSTSSPADVTAAVEAWVVEHVPRTWRDAATSGGRSAIRAVRSRAEYEAWYPAFADSGLVVATWPVAYGGLDLTPDVIKALDAAAKPAAAPKQ